ncbi:MAG TPA: CoA transferase, partial [Actinomycetota bacterium]|nr:CoA transferase [Actinomycetota bacterium]
MSQAAGPLDGLVVADFSRVLAGPFATMLLGDLGADVVKVEHPGGGDETRAWGPPWQGGHSTYYLAVNRNKRSVALDLKDDHGRRAARALAGRADVVVENFKAGSMERLGLGYEELSRDNPGLVWCSISGFGRGAGAALPGYDFLVQAMSGLMSITGPSGG